MIRRIVEGALFLIALLFAAKWMFDPKGHYEPIIVICTLMLMLIAHFAGRKDEPLNNPERDLGQPVDPGVPTVIPKEKVRSYDNDIADLPRFSASGTSSFFADRFAQAFPGVRDTRWFERQIAIERLAILLQAPLIFRTGENGTVSPIWWIGRGNLQIERFARLDEETVLMGIDEFRISRIAAVPGDSYWQSFVYVETLPSKPTGRYPRTTEHFEQCKQTFGYVWEEYGLVDGKTIVTRAEYDDGAAEIGGRVQDIRGRTELRARYISPYNFILCAHSHPLVMGSDYDAELKRRLDRLLTDPSEFPALREWVLAMPRPPRWDS